MLSVFSKCDSLPGFLFSMLLLYMLQLKLSVLCVMYPVYFLIVFRLMLVADININKEKIINNYVFQLIVIAIVS